MSSATSTVSITCGNCGGKHGSVGAVKRCYDSADRTSQPAPSHGYHRGTAPATERQMEFIQSLFQDREHTYQPWEEWQEEGRRAIAGDRKAASALIECLLKFPKVCTTDIKDSTIPVPAGYYAIDIDETVKFYRVDRPTEGRYRGRTFVKVQASDEFHRLSAATAKTVLKAIIRQGMPESSARYGQLIGRCGKCNRTLTDETSRKIGIGPVCRAGA